MNTLTVSVAFLAGVAVGWLAGGSVSLSVLKLQEALTAKQFEVDVLRRRLMTGSASR